jgi:hypothetical protein
MVDIYGGVITLNSKRRIRNRQFASCGRGYSGILWHSPFITAKQQLFISVAFFLFNSITLTQVLF